MTRITAISGSLRSASFNTSLLRAAAELSSYHNQVGPVGHGSFGGNAAILSFTIFVMEQLDYMSDTRMCYLLQPKKQLSHLNEAYLGRFGCPKNRLLKRILASIL